jgi:hypothetical protein
VRPEKSFRCPARLPYLHTHPKVGGGHPGILHLVLAKIDDLPVEPGRWLITTERLRISFFVGSGSIHRRRQCCQRCERLTRAIHVELASEPGAVPFAGEADVDQRAGLALTCGVHPWDPWCTDDGFAERHPLSP